MPHRLVTSVQLCIRALATLGTRVRAPPCNSAAALRCGASGSMQSCNPGRHIIHISSLGHSLAAASQAPIGVCLPAHLESVAQVCTCTMQREERRINKRGAHLKLCAALPACAHAHPLCAHIFFVKIDDPLAEAAQDRSGRSLRQGRVFT